MRHCVTSRSVYTSIYIVTLMGYDLALEAGSKTDLLFIIHFVIFTLFLDM